MPHESNLADYVNVEGISSSFNNNLREFGNKLHNGFGDTFTKTLDKKLSKYILIIGMIFISVYTSLWSIGYAKIRELEKGAIRTTTIRREFNRGYELYNPNIAAVFRRYDNLLDTIRVRNALYIDFNRDGNAEVIISPIKMYNSWDGKTDAEERMMFRNADECIKDIKEELGVK